MKIELLSPDVAPAPDNAQPANPGAFAAALDDLGAALSGADDAENAYAGGSGDLGRAVYERARADVELSVATAAAQRAAQAINTLFNMQL